MSNDLEEEKYLYRNSISLLVLNQSKGNFLTIYGCPVSIMPSSMTKNNRKREKSNLFLLCVRNKVEELCSGTNFNFKEPTIDHMFYSFPNFSPPVVIGFAEHDDEATKLLLEGWSDI